MKIAIIGAGGMGRELRAQILDNSPDEETVFFVGEDFYYDNVEIFPLTWFDPNKYLAVVAVGDSRLRANIVKSLPINTKYLTFIHKSVQIFSKIEIGEGSIICAGSILTTNIKIGKHAQLNRATNISHDCVIGDFFTTAPGVHVSGNCVIGNRVYMGCLSSVREKILICDDATIGLNSGVVKDIIVPGTYVGTPAHII